MLIIGELINSSRRAIAEAIDEKNKIYLQDLARRQVEAGAQAIDVNTAATDNEIENMVWLIDILQEIIDVPLCIDSPNPIAMEAGLARCRQNAIVNSISAQVERWNSMLPLVQKYSAKVVALCMDDKGLPRTMFDRLRVAHNLVAWLVASGVPMGDIFLDPLVNPLVVNHESGAELLKSTRLLREKYPDFHIITGLSNVSFGLPERRLLNRVFMLMGVAAGIDSFILDPLDKTLMSLLAGARALAGKDNDCQDFIAGVRQGKITAN